MWYSCVRGAESAPLFRAHPLNLFSPAIPSTAAKVPPQWRHYTLQVVLTLKTPYRDGTTPLCPKTRSALNYAESRTVETYEGNG